MVQSIKNYITAAITKIGSYNAIELMQGVPIDYARILLYHECIYKASSIIQ